MSNEQFECESTAKTGRVLIASPVTITQDPDRAVLFSVRDDEDGMCVSVSPTDARRLAHALLRMVGDEPQPAPAQPDEFWLVMAPNGTVHSQRHFRYAAASDFAKEKLTNSDGPYVTIACRKVATYKASRHIEVTEHGEVRDGE